MPEYIQMLDSDSQLYPLLIFSEPLMTRNILDVAQ